jgi:hypothetical protein
MEPGAGSEGQRAKSEGQRESLPIVIGRGSKGIEKYIFSLGFMAIGY